MHTAPKRLGLVYVGVGKGRWGEMGEQMACPLRDPPESEFLPSHLVTAILVSDVTIFL